MNINIHGTYTLALTILLLACTETPPIDETPHITIRCFDSCEGQVPTISLMTVLLTRQTNPSHAGHDIQLQLGVKPQNPSRTGRYDGQNFFVLQSDMPMPETTIILAAEKYMRSPSSFSALVGDSRRRETTRHFLVEMKKGTLHSGVLHTFATGNVFLPPPESRYGHLALDSSVNHRVGDTIIEHDYEWNPYNVGDPSSITFTDLEP